MVNSDVSVNFEKLTSIDTEKFTLIEGLPGNGLVASIAVEQIKNQLDLDHHGNIISDDFPPVTSFKNGRVEDLVRVYSGSNPDIMTLQSDLTLPPSSFSALSKCLLEDLSKEFKRAIFLAGTSAKTEEQIGEIFGVATTDRIEKDLRNANIELAKDDGLIGGVTGALVKECYHGDIPAAVLIVGTNPYIPNPKAAISVIENALEPLVDFDIDTTELKEQSDKIQEKMEQVAQQYQKMTQEQNKKEQLSTPMYQ